MWHWELKISCFTGNVNFKQCLKRCKQMVKGGKMAGLEIKNKKFISNAIKKNISAF